MLLWFRYAFQAALTLILRFPKQGLTLFHTPNPRFQALRGLLLLASSCCAFFGLQHLPVGEFTALVMLSPVVATALAAIVLKNRVSPVRWLLLATGLIGVLVVIRPGGQIFGWAILFPLVLIGTFSSFQVLTSRLSSDENPYTTHFYTGFVGSLATTPILYWSWNAQALINFWPLFLVIGFLGTFGHLMLIRAYQRASAPVLMPYLYSQIAFAMLLGWVAFDHFPDHMAWVGMTLIAASGIMNALITSQASLMQTLNPKP